MIEAQQISNDLTNQTFTIPIELIGSHISPEVLAGIGLKPLQEIAKVYSPNVIYPMIKDIRSSETAVLESIMRFADQVENEVLFLQAISQVRLFLDNENRIDFLLKQGLEFENGESNGSFIVRALINHQSAFIFASQNLIAAETSNVSDRSYLIFLSSRPSSLVTQKINSISPVQFETALGPRFQKKGYGSYVRVLKSANNGRMGFAIDRAGRLSGREVLDTKDTRKTRFERWLRSDYLFYDEKKNALWIHAKAPLDAAIYAEVVGELIGDVANFCRSDELDLDFVLTGDLPLRVQKARSEMMVKVSVRRLEISAPTTTYAHQAPKYARCLTEMDFNQRDGISIGNKVKKLVLDVGLSPNNDETGRIIITGNRIALYSGLSEVQAGKLLHLLGLQEEHAYA